MNEIFKTQSGSLELNDQEIAINYSGVMKFVLGVTYFLYIKILFSEFTTYSKTGAFESLSTLVVMTIFFVVLVYATILHVTNNRIDYRSIRQVRIRYSAFMARTVVCFVLKSGRRKRVYIDYNVNVINSIETAMSKKAIPVTVTI